MDNNISFTASSNKYVAITKKGWQSPIPSTAYKQINAKRKLFENFARKNNLKITFTDANNMLPELHTGSVSRFLSNKLSIEIEKKPSFADKIKVAFSNLISKKIKRNDTPKLSINTVSYYEKDSKNIPSLKEKGKMGLFIDYEPTENNLDKQINLNTIVDLLQKAVGKKFT